MRERYCNRSAKIGSHYFTFGRYGLQVLLGSGDPDGAGYVSADTQRAVLEGYHNRPDWAPCPYAEHTVRETTKDALATLSAEEMRRLKEFFQLDQ